MRRRPTPAERELRAIIQRMNATSPRRYSIAAHHAGYYKGSPRYKHCLAFTEPGDDTMYKASAWYSSHAAMLDGIKRKVQRAA